MSEILPPWDSVPMSRAERRAFTRSRSNDDIYTYDSRMKPAENPIEKPKKPCGATPLEKTEKLDKDEKPEKPCGEKSEKPLEKTQHLAKDVKPLNPFDKVVDNADFMKTYIKPSEPMSMSAVRAMLDARNRRKYRSQSL